MPDSYKVLFTALYADFFKSLFSNNLLKKSTREGNGRDLEETDPSLLKFYVTEYYTYHLGRLVLTKPTPLGKRMEPSPK